MKAMILAAGLGTRLLPHTLKRPKPLFPILNHPLLDLTIRRMQKSGVSCIVVNAHHLRQQIKKALQGEPGIMLQEEETILGTGGGLRLALSHFNREPFLAVNGDIYHTIDYRSVFDFHCSMKPDVTLVLHDHPRFNSVTVDEKGHVTGFAGTTTPGNKKERLLAFTGIHVINPEFLEAIPADTEFCIIEHYRTLLEQGGVVRAYMASGHFWTDMGTPDDYLKLHGGLLEKKIPAYEELDTAITDTPFVGPDEIFTRSDVSLLDWACIGKGATIGSGATIQRSVIWDDVIVPAGSLIKDALITTARLHNFSGTDD